MKKIFSIIFAFFAVFLLCSCGAKNESTTNPPEEGVKSMKIIVGDSEFEVSLTENSTTKALVKLLPLELDMRELHKNEKYAYIQQLPIDDAYKPVTIECGDVMLYGVNCLVIFYKTFEPEAQYTRIGKITNTEGLAKALDSGDVTVKWTL